MGKNKNNSLSNKCYNFKLREEGIKVKQSLG